MRLSYETHLPLGMFIFVFAAIAHAQAVTVPQFGDQISEISWLAWGLVFAYGLVGAMMRLQEALKKKELVPTFWDIASWLLFGLFAAIATFGMVEMANRITGVRLPDLIEGALVSAGAYNRDRVVNAFTTWLQNIIGITSRGDSVGKTEA